jgi:CheY-like chemotaxis protein
MQAATEAVVSRPVRLEALPHGRRRPEQRGSSSERAFDDASIYGRFDTSASARPSRLPTLLTGVRIVVVDDDEEARELFAAALSTCGGQIATAGSAAEALRVLAEHRAHVVVSDIAMPGGDGYWLVREIRKLADARINRVPVVAVTAYGREHSKARALASGFADHLQKPVDPEVLCRTVARAALSG